MTFWIRFYFSNLGTFFRVHNFSSLFFKKTRYKNKKKPQKHAKKQKNSQKGLVNLQLVSTFAYKKVFKGNEEKGFGCHG